MDQQIDSVLQYAAKTNAEEIRKRLMAQQNQASVFQEKNTKQSKITSSQQQPQSEEEDGFVYPEIETTKQYELHRRERAKALARANAILTSPEFAGAPGHVIETRRKAYEAMIDAKYPEIKPFDQSIGAKEIIAEMPFFRKKDDMIRNIKFELEEASKLTNKQEKAARIRTIVPKLVQSTGTGGADALQPAEVVLGAPEMQSYLGWAKSIGSDPTSPTTLAAYLTDSAVKTNQFFEADPDAYIKKIKGIYNTFVKTRNEKIKDFERLSSPDWIRRNVGIKPFKMFDTADEIAAQTPLSPSTRAAVETVSSSAPQEPAITPAKQRIKFVYDSKGNLVPQ